MQSFHCFNLRPLLFCPRTNEPRKSLLLPTSLSHTVTMSDCLSRSLGLVSKKNSSSKTGLRFRHFVFVLNFRLCVSGRSCLQFYFNRYLIKSSNWIHPSLLTASQKHQKIHSYPSPANWCNVWRPPRVHASAYCSIAIWEFAHCSSPSRAIPCWNDPQVPGERWRDTAWYSSTI